VRLERLTRGHVVAAVAALALLIVMAMTWYGSQQADLARQLGNAANIGGAEAGETGRAVKADADRIVARDEKNPWQEQARVDRVLLALLLISVFLALLAAVVRAAGKGPAPPWTLSAFTALTAAATAVFLAFRIVNQPGNDAETTVKTGAFLGLLLVAVIGVGAASGFRTESESAEARPLPTAPDNADAAPTATP
jgi:drug/metabolite transporter (DMT)-like permease